MSRLQGLVLWSTVIVLGLVPVPTLAQLPLPVPPPGFGEQLLQPSRPAPIILTPALAVFEEYDDNLFLDNRNRRADWITAIAPGLTLAAEGETYKLAVGYSFTAEAYARETSLDQVFDRQNFSLDGSYRASPHLTLTLVERYVVNVSSNLVSASMIATGRSRVWSNAVTPGATWRVTPVTTLHLSGTYLAERFERQDLSDSDVYRASAAIERRLTRRFSGTAGYEAAYLDVERERPVTTHTPRLGGIYRFTETLTGTASGGPTFVLREEGRDRVTLAATANLRQRLPLGSAGVQYERTIAAAGGLGGTTDSDAVTGLLQITSLARGFAVELAPRYAHARSDDGSIDVHAFTLGLRSSYRLTRWMVVFAAYTFFRQRSGGATAGDVDQNRVSFGLQIGYPLRFE